MQIIIYVQFSLHNYRVIILEIDIHGTFWV